MVMALTVMMIATMVLEVGATVVVGKAEVVLVEGVDKVMVVMVVVAAK